MTPDEQATELQRLEVLAKAWGLSSTSFELLLKDPIDEVEHSSIVHPPIYMFSELQRRIQPPRTIKFDSLR